MLTRNAAPASQGRLQSGRDVRLACRSGGLDGPTAGLAPGFVQGNLAILPRDWADEFLRFCVANPKPCLLIGIAEPVHGCPLLGGDRKAPNSRRSEGDSWLRLSLELHSDDSRYAT